MDGPAVDLDGDLGRDKGDVYLVSKAPAPHHVVRHEVGESQPRETVRERCVLLWRQLRRSAGSMSRLACCDPQRCDIAACLDEFVNRNATKNEQAIQDVLRLCHRQGVCEVDRPFATREVTARPRAMTIWSARNVIRRGTNSLSGPARACFHRDGDRDRESGLDPVPDGLAADAAISTRAGAN